MESKPYELMLELSRAGDPFRFRYEEQEYSLRRDDGSYASARFPWSGPLLSDLECLSRRKPDRVAVQRLGNMLRSFLAPLGWRQQEHQLQGALEAGRPVHLICRFAAAELYSLPWELLTLENTGQHLGEHPGCLVRYEWPGTRTANRPVSPPPGGRILFAWSAAGGSLPVEQHLAALRSACARSGHPFDPRRDVLEHVSVASLARALAESPEPIGALHLLCHGAGGASGSHGLVWNASQGGEPELIDAGVLRELLAPHAASVRMVVLCACRSGDTAQPANPLGGIAQAIHRVGIPAVVASRLPLSQEGSVQLTETLYEELLTGPTSLQEALRAARRRLQLRQGPAPLDWASLQLYARAEEGPDIRPFIFRPYQGLLAFQPGHRRFFFGREQLQRTLLRRMKDAREGRLPRFQVLAGASGCGKSSLVMAGLVPELPEDWDVLTLRPGIGGEDPAAAAAAVHEAVEHRTGSGRKLLIVVDPFEEIFTHLSAAGRQAFVNALWEVAYHPEHGALVLLMLRVDAFERCGELTVDGGQRCLDAILYDDAHRLFVPQLPAEQYDAVIQAPAHRVGLDFEAGLVDLLKRDVGQEPGALPLLQYALDLLWRQREGNRLTLAAYQEIGGAVGALTRAADCLYEALTAEEKQQARRLMVELVEFRDDSAPHTRRRVPMAQVRPAGEAGRAFDAVLEKLVASRLVVQGHDGATPSAPPDVWLEVAHESLIRRWKLLEGWVRADRERVLRLREVETWAREWQPHRGDADGGSPYLLSGIKLGYARRLQEQHTGELTDVANQFIDASWARSEHLSRLAREQQERLKDFACLLVAEKLRWVDPTSALLLLQEVSQPGRELTWTQLALGVLRLPVTRALLVGHEGPVLAIAFSPDGERVVTASRDGTARVWRTHGRGGPIVLRGHRGPVTSAAFSPDGSRIITASEDSSARLWEAAGGGEERRLQGHEGAVVSAAFSPDGARVVTASRDGTARVWRTDGAGAPVVLRGHDTELEGAAFSPDGSRVVTSSRDGTARIWRVDGGMGHVLLRGHGSYVAAASFSPDGSHVLTASEDGTARVWRADGIGEPVVLPAHPRCARAVSFSPDGTRVLTAAWKGEARLWPVAGGGDPLVLEGHTDELRAAAFSPDGAQVLTGSYDGTARVWTTEGNIRSRVLRGHTRPVRAVAFSQDGAWVATASDDGTARIWQAGEETDHQVLRGHVGVVRNAAFSSDGKRVVTAGQDGTARLWRVDGKGPTLVLRGHGGGLNAATFSPDGTQVLTASDDGTARLWRADGAGRPAVLQGHGGRVSAAVFSPDGGRVLTSSWDGKVRIWRTEDMGRSPFVLDGHTDRVRGATFSPDGQWILTTSDDETARLWRADGRGVPVVLRQGEGPTRFAFFSPDGALLAATRNGRLCVWPADGQGEPLLLQGQAALVRAAAFSPDGTRIAAVSDDNVVRIWTLEPGAEPVLLDNHGGSISTLVFQPCGSRLLTASTDGTARLWSADGRGEPVVLKGHTGPIHTAAFHPMATQVVTAAADGTARIWTLSVETLMERLRSATTACLSVQQRQQYLGAERNELREEAGA